MSFYLLGAIFLGWSLGTNDAANVFGTAVATRSVKYRRAVILTAIFVILGAIINGRPGINTLDSITHQNLFSAFVVSISAGIVVIGMSFLKLPVSTSQAVIGGILGVGFINHNIEWRHLVKVGICWVSTPIGAAIIAFLLYFIFRPLINKITNPIKRNNILTIGLIIAGSCGAYALGANNVANVIGVFVGEGNGMLNPLTATIIGGSAIAFGTLTYSRKVMYTVGKNLVVLDSFTAFIAVLAEAITVYIYALIGVPVSTSQAIVGAVLGIGILKGIRTIRKKTLRNILLGWIATPVIAAIVSFGIFKIIKFVKLY
ncbi:MAG: inorganic phosphate transporter [Candidatus Cloacimonadota bacterium]|nr:inorganic phosphate transporter [Candidatus Cloacimonadota bacterium]